MTINDNWTTRNEIVVVSSMAILCVWLDSGTVPVVSLRLTNTSTNGYNTNKIKKSYETIQLELRQASHDLILC